MLKTASLAETLVGKQLPSRNSEVSAWALLSVHTRVTESGPQSSFMSVRDKTQRAQAAAQKSPLKTWYIAGISPAYTDTAAARLRSSAPWRKKAIIPEHFLLTLRAVFFFFFFYSWLGSINQGDQFHLVISGAAAIRLIRKQASYYNTHQSHFGVAWSVTCNQIAHFVSFGCHEKALWSGMFHTLKVSHLWDNLTVFEFNFRQQGNRFITILAPMMQAVNMGEVVNSVWSSVSPERIILLQWKQLPLHSNTLCHWFKV